MNLKQTVYFMALVGGLAGLGTWALTDLSSGSGLLSIQQEQNWLLSGFYACLLGTAIAGLTVGFADHWGADGFLGRWAAMGAILGLGAGIVSGLLGYPIFTSLISQNAPTVAAVGRIATWAITGALIGLATGLRWFSVNRLRAVHALMGGLIGGIAGGTLFATLGDTGAFQALAFVLTGVGITLGVTLAPVVVRSGALQFISSGDARAQNKYGSPRQVWPVQEGDRLVIGSQSARMTMTVYSPVVQIYLPDAMVAPLHAVLFERGKRFFIQAHRDNIGAQGQPRSVLQVKGTNVVGDRELRNGDEIMFGQTMLVFLSRRPDASHAQTYAPMTGSNWR